LDSQGAVMQQTYDELISARDDAPIRLRE
jgi:hypothetical protein